MQEIHIMTRKVKDENFENSRKRVEKKGNSGLPEGAVRCKDSDIGEMLIKMQIERIRLYNFAGFSGGDGSSAFKDCECEESDFHGQTFNCQLHPEVEGYYWYRGFAITVDGGKVFIFTGWMQPWYEGGSPDPIVYSTKLLAREKILEIVTKYCTWILNRIAKSWIEIKKGIATREAKEAYKEAKSEGMNNMNALSIYNKTFKESMKKTIY